MKQLYRLLFIDDGCFAKHTPLRDLVAHAAACRGQREVS